MSKYFYKSLMIIVLLLIQSCGRTGKSNMQTESEVSEQGLIRITSAQFKENRFELGTLQKKEFKQYIQVSGMIDVPPQNKAVISVPVGGYITKTQLLVGDQVRKGQVLVTLENPEFIKLQQNCLEVKQQLSYLKAEYERHKKLYEENITSQKNFLKAESEYKTALATYQGLSQQLRILHISPEALDEGRMTTKTNIYAPISGSISKMNIMKGAFVSPATEILEIINTEHIHLELEVFEKDIIHVKEGQTIEFRIPEATDEFYMGKVYRVGSSIDENRRILVHGHIESTTSFNLLKGMFVEARIVTESEILNALPETALVEVGDLNYVLKLINKTEEEYTFQPFEVEVLEVASDYAAIDSEAALHENEQYLTVGAFSLMTDY